MVSLAVSLVAAGFVFAEGAGLGERGREAVRWLDAQARAVVVLVSFLEPPVVSPAMRAVTGEPEVEETKVSGNPTSVYRPAGEGPYPTIVVANGTLPQGREYEGIRDLSTGLARAGYLVVVPDLPGLMDDTISPETVEETVAVGDEVSGWEEVRGGRVGFIGVSTGATLALLAAEDLELRERVSAVAGVAPYTDIRTVLSLATTGHYRLDGEMVPYETGPLLSYVVGRSVISTLPPGPDREKLLRELDDVGRYEPDPLAVYRDFPPEEVGCEARRVLAFLQNRDPERFWDLYRGLPQKTREDLLVLSPIDGAGRLEAPVELVTGREDRYFPVSESYRLRSVAPERVVTVTEVLDHSEIQVSPDTLPDFARLVAFAGRGLAELRSDPDQDSRS
ncbi:Alpha/beta hydrolase family (plasmid) [Rubrobacter radiotolerans]|uniref:Alpha/beta fold hydrolase n=1 Tax=Rubrobacter radiotolerans TaxID=42256 RepID=A0A023X8A2_RUBRA|nr:CocE/NonD family hydrolase [Rubrobacter radiotolerans]AHY48275.1 Alpha/beta hydrolase family [Rubrobacter radiotolerans]MDX5895548.1 alpha/beta fold hydrolase [Rubrobacter radiotolerans]SMC01472.1 Alpha/beta hydrolase family protein [Rubrobacter radiotolerans DSM 5868]